MKRPSDSMQIEHHGWTYRVDGDALIASRGGEEQMRLHLAPLIEGRQTTVQRWIRKGRDHFSGRLDSGGRIHLAVDCGHLCYWMETDIVQIETLAFFPEMSFKGKYWQTYMSDEHDRRWDVAIDQEVGISSCYDLFNPFGADGHGMTDPGDFPPYWIWNVPVRAFSVQTEAGWVGFSMPGALSVGLVRLRMEKGRLSVNFDVVRSTCREGMMPRVYLVTGFPDPYDLLDEHRIISDNLGLTVKKDSNHPAWWTNPEYNYWDEYCRLQRENREKGEKGNPLTQELYVDWLNTTKKILGMKEMNCTLEQGCYNFYGEYVPTEEMGGIEGVRKMVDRLREEGTHVGHYIHPYMVNTKSRFWKEHPEAFCEPKEKSHRTWWPLEESDQEAEFRLLDWTHPKAREYMEGIIRFLYSDEPGCLNCDMVRSNNWLSPDPRRYEFHDPDWGIGELMTHKVQRFIYQTAKKMKPHCMVPKLSIGDPYLQPWADADYLCEEWNGYTDNWYRRGRIATRTMPGSIFLTDPFCVTITKGYEYYMGMMAWNFPMTCSVHHAVHPYMYYRELKEKDYKRRSAGFHAAMNAPLRIGDLSRVDIRENGEMEQWRRRTEGKLAGFYAALAIGKKTLVTYSETEARVATSITRSVEFPLPPGAKLVRVEVVPHEGAPEQWPYEQVTTGESSSMRMHIEDCGEKALFYRVDYALP